MMNDPFVCRLCNQHSHTACECPQEAKSEALNAYARYLTRMQEIRRLNGIMLASETPHFLSDRCGLCARIPQTAIPVDDHCKCSLHARNDAMTVVAKFLIEMSNIRRTHQINIVPKILDVRTPRSLSEDLEFAHRHAE